MVLAGTRHPAFALLGGPGAGKGTLAGRLASECGMHHIDIGALLRCRAERQDAIGRRIHRKQSQGQMVPKELVLAVLGEHLSACDPATHLVLDGFPRTMPQLAAADDGRVPIAITRAIWLEVPRTVAESRLRLRAGTAPRNDDGIAAASQRFTLMDHTVEAVRRELSARGVLEVVDASRAADEVFHDVSQRLQHLFTDA